MHRPIKTKIWVKFLKHKGCEEVRISSSHHHWKCPGCFRTITFWGAKKEIPFMHIRNDLKTMGVSVEEFEDWMNN